MNQPFYFLQMTIFLFFFGSARSLVLVLDCLEPIELPSSPHPPPWPVTVASDWVLLLMAADSADVNDPSDTMVANGSGCAEDGMGPPGAGGPLLLMCPIIPPVYGANPEEA